MSLKESSAYNYQGLQDTEVQQPLELYVYRKKGMDRELSTQLLTVVALVASLLVLFIYSNIRLMELSDQMSIKKSEYDILKSENRRMMVELEGKISLRNIEESAVATMGMARAESYQVEYVNLGSEDEIEFTTSKLDPVFSKIRSLVDVFLNYIGF